MDHFLDEGTEIQGGFVLKVNVFFRVLGLLGLPQMWVLALERLPSDLSLGVLWSTTTCPGMILSLLSVKVDKQIVPVFQCH